MLLASEIQEGYSPELGWGVWPLKAGRGKKVNYLPEPPERKEALLTPGF